jgi:hypothetical protein
MPLASKCIAVAPLCQRGISLRCVVQFILSLTLDYIFRLKTLSFVVLMALCCYKLAVLKWGKVGLAWRVRGVDLRGANGGRGRRSEESRCIMGNGGV